MVGRLHLQPLPQARPQRRQRYSQFLRRAEEPGNRLIQRQSGRRRRLRLARSNVDSAAAPELHPTLAFQLAVSRADRVGMHVKAPRQVARAGSLLCQAGQAGGRWEIIRELIDGKTGADDDAAVDEAAWRDYLARIQAAADSFAAPAALSARSRASMRSPSPRTKTPRRLENSRKPSRP